MLRANMLATEYVLLRTVKSQKSSRINSFNAKLCRAGISYIAYNH